jgi:hypothetical protein
MKKENSKPHNCRQGELVHADPSRRRRQADHRALPRGLPGRARPGGRVPARQRSWQGQGFRQLPGDARRRAAR